MDTTGIRKLALGATPLAAVVVTGLVVPSAQAATENCQLGYACVWTGTTYSGTSDGTATGGALPDTIKKKASSAAGNGKSCRYTNFYDGNSPTTSTTYFQLYSKTLIGGNYRDPMLSNGAGVGPGSGQNWDKRISTAVFTGC